MTLHTELYHDDGVAAGTAGRGGGTAITAALVKNSDAKINDIDGVLPNFLGCLLSDIDVHTDEIVGKAWWELQPNTWPATKRITGWGDYYPCEATDSAGETHHPTLPYRINFSPIVDLPLTKGMDWISSFSKVAGTIVNSDIGLIFVYSFGTRYPYTGGRLHRIGKVADGAMAAADVFDEAWTAQLTSVTPGLDPNIQYVLHGVGYEPAAKDKLAVAVRVGKEQGAHKMIGFGTGNMLGYVETFYAFDGIPFQGDDALIAEHLGGVTDTPYAYIIAEEVGAASRATTPVARAAELKGLPFQITPAAGIAAGVRRIPQPQQQILPPESGIGSGLFSRMGSGILRKVGF